jgi:HK97 family phage major capsid protein
MDDAEGQEFDNLGKENESIDAEIVRLKRHQEQIARAKPVENVNTADAGARARSGVVTVKGADLPQGTAFTRYAIALMRAKGNLVQAEQIARSWRDSTPQVEEILKVAVAVGSTTADGWATELAQYTYMASEFIEYLRPQTIIGKIQGFRRVPFNITIPLQDSGSTVNWVGEAAQKPVGKLHFDTTSFRFAKAAGIVVFTDELVRYSNPSAEALVRQDLAAAIAQFLDEQFTNPAVAAVVNVSPAAITNGAATTAASGTTATDLRNDLATALTAMITANIDPSGMVIIMQPTLAVAISLMRNALGQQEFPGITASGGTLEGYTVITSNSCPTGDVIFIKPSEILMADDGGINLDASTEASLVMDDNVSPATTTLISLWQKNLIALRAERIINWGRRRAAAVYYLTAADYGAASPA